MTNPLPAMAQTPVDRRILLQAAAGATAAFAVARAFDPAAAAAPAGDGIFGYGVASGDPTADSVMIWTRATPPAAPGQPLNSPGSGRGRALTVTWEVALDRRFNRRVATGTVRTSARRDHTVKVDVTGLSPYTRYFYRFTCGSEVSPLGHTQTAPDIAGEVHALRLGLVSCSNYTGGYFTAYRELARRDDLDMILHVGDYIYEYGNGADRYGPAALVGVRDGQPETETIDLAGYRLRHALHKADPDAQLAHRKHPWITIFDDHEVANNSWADGAENHQAGEGDYRQRRDEAMQAYLEWMPFRLPGNTVPHQGTRFFKRFTFGDLADLTILETRQNRSLQVTVPTSPLDGFTPIGVNPAVDAAIADPSRHLPEPEQLDWIKAGVSRRGRSWHLLGNQVMVTPVQYPGEALGIDGVTFVNADQWDGYSADQGVLIDHLHSRPARAGDTVVLTGDIHSSWAADIPAELAADGTYSPAGVEFVTPSVTSDGFYEIVSGFLGNPSPEVGVVATNGVTGLVQQRNPWVKYLDGIGHGFTVIDVTPERVQADFHHTPTPTTAQPDPRVDRQVVPTYRRSFQTVAGSRAVSPATGPVGPRSDRPRGRYS